MKRISIVWLVVLQWILGLEWLHSGWGKWTSPDFTKNIGATLQTFAAKTPYHFYAGFLHSFAIPNASLFGSLTRLGEICVALAFIIGGVLVIKQVKLSIPILWIMVIACFAAALMNLNFFLASGWSGPSASGINALMGLMEIVLAIFYISNRTEI